MSRKMMSRKKSASVRKRLIFTIVFFGVLVLLLLILMIRYLVVSSLDDYKVQSRIDNVITNRKKDQEDYQTIGWIQVQGTNIDAPVLRGINNKFEYPVETENYGWTVNEDNNFHNVVNIFGHNIFNLGPAPKRHSDTYKRFEELMSFVYPDFAEDNQYIQLTIDGKDYVYKIFSVSFLYATDVDMFPYGDYSKEQLDEHLKLLNENSIYDYDIDVNSDDSIISVSTCTRFFGIDGYGDILVSGRLVRSGEKLKKYSVKKNNNYKMIDEVLKGDDGYDEVGSA